MGDGGAAVGKSKDDDLENPYELLQVEDDAGEKEIKTAYRKISLKCHPDRHPDDPEAAEKFDRLTRAKDLLLDPIRRSELDRKRKAAHDLEVRHAQEDAKRRKLREDLEGRETAANAKTMAAKRAAQDAEARKKFLQQDMASRIRAKEAELANKQTVSEPQPEDTPAADKPSKASARDYKGQDA
ncbi:Dnajc17 [Symbiodinium sp. CCMP2592]|nr:Dnajc17 [Symbiodinium sp. CCMP2592]